MSNSRGRCWTEAELRHELDRYEVELRASGKSRNTIASYVQHPERFINWLVGKYEVGAPSGIDRGTNQRVGRVSTYEPLRAHLADRKEPVVQMTFNEVEEVLGRELPASARRYRPWWSNERSGTHAHAMAWLDAGRKTAHVDVNSGNVEFVK